MGRGSILKTFSEADIESLRPAMKIGLLATVNNEGLPHITLLSSLQAASSHTLTFGQFIEGLAEFHVRKNPRVGFLVMTLKREIWRGTAVFTGTTRSGPELDAYNQVPMFRYNAYVGIHTVFSFDLVEHGGREPLPTGRVVVAALTTKFAGLLTPSGPSRVLNLWSRQLLDGTRNLKFAAFVDSNGFPRIIPVIQARSCPGDRVIFSLAAFGQELRTVPSNAKVAVFGMTLNMESVLVRGPSLGTQWFGFFRCGVMKAEWVYNPMPPVPGQIYPPTELQPVTHFD